MSSGRGKGGDRGGKPVRLADLLAPALDRLGPRGLLKESKLRKAWTQAVGAEVAANASIGRLRGRVLEVHVTSDAWATELTYLASSITQKLNALVHEVLVDEVVVRRRRAR